MMAKKKITELKDIGKANKPEKEMPSLYNNNYLATTPKQKIEEMQDSIETALKCESSVIIIVGGHKIPDGFKIETVSSLAKSLTPFDIMQIVAKVITQSLEQSLKDQERRMGK